MSAVDDNDLNDGPLDGVRIVDLTRLLPGPMCSWYLRGLGASVIKVEAPGLGDPLRAVPPYADDGVGVWFRTIQAGVRSIQLDLRSSSGRQALNHVLAQADVLLEGFRPGAMARLGLDPAELSARHPKLIVASISGYGQTGPLREVAGHDIGYLGYTGVLALTARREDGTPTLPPVPIADLAGGALTSALSVLAALYARDRPSGTQKGRWIDISMTDAALALAAPNLAEAANAEQDPTPGQGILTGALPFYELYRCKCGGLVAVAALEPPFQLAFQQAMGRPMPMRHDEMAALFATDTRDAWASRLAAACVTPVLSPLEALEAPLFTARGRIHGAGRDRRVAPPFWGKMSFVSAPAPAAGTHTAEVLAEAGAPASLISEVCR